MKRYIWIIIIAILSLSLTITALATETEENSNTSEEELTETTETETTETETDETETAEPPQEETPTPSPEQTATPVPTPTPSPKPTISASPMRSVIKPTIAPVYGFDPSNSLASLSDTEEVISALKAVFDENEANSARVEALIENIKVSNRKALISAIDSAPEVGGKLSGWYSANFLIKETTQVTRAEFCHILDALNSILSGSETVARMWGGEYTQVYRMVEGFKYLHGAVGTQFIPTLTDKKIHDNLKLVVNTWAISGSQVDGLPEKFSYINPAQSRELFIICEVIEVQTNAEGGEEYTGYGTSYGGIGTDGMYLHVVLPARDGD